MQCTSEPHSQKLTCLLCAETAEWIEVLLGVETVGDLRHIVLDADPDFPMGRGIGEKFSPLYTLST